MQVVDIQGKTRRGQRNLRWKDSCKRDVKAARLKEDNATHRAACRKKLISYTGDPSCWDKPGKTKNLKTHIFLTLWKLSMMINTSIIIIIIHNISNPVKVVDDDIDVLLLRHGTHVLERYAIRVQ